LVGSPTLSQDMKLGCSWLAQEKMLSDADFGGVCPPLFLPPLGGEWTFQTSWEETPFRYGYGTWTQETGTFTTILGEPPQDRLCATSSLPCDPIKNFDTAHLILRFTIQNPWTGQDSIHPTVTICTQPAMIPANDETSRPVLGASVLHRRPGQYELQATKYWETIARVKLPQALAADVDVSLDLREDVRGVTGKQLSRLPQGGQLGGHMGTVLVVGADVADGVDLEMELQMVVDVEQGRIGGGCVDSDDKTLRVCVSGWPVLSKFIVESETWEPVGPRSPENKFKQVLDTNTSLPQAATFAIISTVPCCNYEGEGRSCGDKVCVNSEDPSNFDNEVVALLGGLTGSKMPSITASTRPTAEQDFEEYLLSLESGTMSLRTIGPWFAVVPPDDPYFGCTAEQPGWDSQSVGWLPARFGHALVAVSPTRMAIYGGIGCARYSEGDRCSRVCVELGLLNDLWEFDALQFEAGAKPFKQYELSPSLQGIASPIGIPLPGKQSVFITVGGGMNLAMSEMMQGKPVPPSEEVFQVRRISYREGEVTSFALSEFSSVIAHSAVYNDTHVLIYGGYIRNRLTSAVLVFDLTAASPFVGLSRAPGLAAGTKARAFPALSKPNDQTLIIFGGVRSPSNTNSGTMTYEANSELWVLDLATQRWRQIHDSDVGPPLRAFQATASWKYDADTLVLAHGGFVGGFSPTLDYEVELDSLGSVWPSSQLGSEFETKWYGMHPLSPDPGEECCAARNVPTRCGSRPIYGCAMGGTAMHSIISGTFVAGASSLLTYGGIQKGMRASREMWYLEVERMQFGFEYDLVLQGVTVETFDDGSAFAIIENLLVNGFHQFDEEREVYFAIVCPTLLTGMLYHFRALPYDLGDGIDRVVVKYRSTYGPEYPGWGHCFTEALDTRGQVAQEIWASLMSTWYSNTRLNTSTLVWEEQTTLLWNLDEWFHLRVEDGLMDFYLYSDEDDCSTGCRRGICQGIVEGTMVGELREDGTAVYCYGDGDGCSQGYTCGLPLERHGHTMGSFTMGGSSDVMLIVAGESTDLRPDAFPAILTRDVHAGFFSLSAVTFSKLWVAGSKGDACDDGTCGSSNCPCARRDASIAVLGNVGSSNGKLLLFGGITAAGDTSPAWAYLTKSDASAVIPLNDLWYLDLSSLTETCIKDGKCSSALPWTKIEVPGRAVPSRWGAGIVLDTAQNLYVTGGATVVNGAWTEVADLYVFQLGDPYYKKCSATGKGLTIAEAGVPAVFYLQCKDSLDAPANGARFQIDISGPVDMSPSVLSVGTGLYKCEFLPVRASSDYEITIKVGRGGPEYQDLIAGVDGDPSDSVHDYRGFYGDLGGSSNPNPFSLKVMPGSTDPTTSVATGSLFTLTTAGIISSFTVLARDAFLNRRPGGDSISILMMNPAIPNEKPRTATVTDNSDGSYTAVYAITQSGVYQLAITFGGALGAGTPRQLEVQTAEALIERTYVYGSLLSIKAGETSTIYVQTRDRYGNKLRVDPRVVPTGSEDINFELCTAVGDDTKSPCRGGTEDMNVGVTIDYGYNTFGTLYTNVNGVVTNIPNYGLYRISFFPFNFGDSFIVEVTHNDRRIPCYFDSEEDPGADLADACYSDYLEATASSDSRRTYKGAERVTLASQLSQDPKQRKTTISKAFIPPETGKALWWVMFAPICCAAVGLFIELCLTVYRVFQEKRQKKFLRNLSAEWASAAVGETKLSPPPSVEQEMQHVHETVVAGTVFSTPEALARDGSVQAVVPPPSVTEDPNDAEKIVADLEARGLLTPAEAAKFRTMTANENPMSQGVIDAHVRTLERTARAIKQMTGKKEGSSFDTASLRGVEDIALGQHRISPSPGVSMTSDVVSKAYPHRFRV